MMKRFHKSALIGGLAFASVSAFAVMTLAPDYLTEKLLPTTLYKNERWKGGNAKAELADFIDHAVRVLRAQVKILNDKEKGAANGNRSHRVFHAKSHGCLIGTLTLTSEYDRLKVDPSGRTLKGVFKAGKEYKVVGRFSNGVGWDQPDQVQDVRGLALKLIVPAR